MHLSRCVCLKHMIRIWWLFYFLGMTASEMCILFILLFQAEIFQEFTLKDDLVGFQVNLTVLLDCLNIFGASTVPGKKKHPENLSKKIVNQMWSIILVCFNHFHILFFPRKCSHSQSLLQEYRQPCGCATEDMVTRLPCFWRRVELWLCARSTHRNQRSQLTLTSAAPMSQTRLNYFIAL